MQTFDWWYDDLKQVGLDFEDEAQVATYDARQSSSAERDAALLTELGLTAGMAMADIGCGTGVMVCEAARMCRSAIGIDVSAAMLRSAQARATRLGCENLVFQRAGFFSTLEYQTKCKSGSVHGRLRIKDNHSSQVLNRLGSIPLPHRSIRHQFQRLNVIRVLLQYRQ